MSIDPKLIDVTLLEETGYPDEMAGEDTADVLRSAALESGIQVVPFPKHFYIPRKDWLEVANMAKQNRTRAIDFLDRFTNQNPSHECVAHAAQAVNAMARERQRRIALGPPEPHIINPLSAKAGSVWLSPLSVYAEANPRRYGGSNVRQVLEIAGRRGFLPDKKQPRDYGFKHTLIGTSGQGNETQSGGQWVSLDNFPDGWEETAKWFRPLEVIFPETFEEMICLLLGGPEGMGLAIATGGRGHSIPYAFVLPDEELIGYPDSYDIIRYDSFRNVRMGGMYAVLSTVTPDSWDKPAG